MRKILHNKKALSLLLVAIMLLALLPIGALADSIESLTAAVSTAQEAVAAAEARVTSAEAALHTAQSELHAAENAKAAAQSDLSAAETAKAAAQSGLSAAEAAKAAAEAAIPEKEAAVSAASNALAQANSALEAARAAINDENPNADAVNAAEGAVSSAQAALTAAENALAAARSDASNAASTISTANAAIESATASIETANDAIAAADDAIGIKTAAVTAARSELTAAQTALDAAEDTLDAAQSALDDANVAAGTSSRVTVPITWPNDAPDGTTCALSATLTYTPNDGSDAGTVRLKRIRYGSAVAHFTVPLAAGSYTSELTAVTVSNRTNFSVSNADLRITVRYHEAMPEEASGDANPASDDLNKKTPVVETPVSETSGMQTPGTEAPIVEGPIDVVYTTTVTGVISWVGVPDGATPSVTITLGGGDGVDREATSRTYGGDATYSFENLPTRDTLTGTDYQAYTIAAGAESIEGYSCGVSCNGYAVSVTYVPDVSQETTDAVRAVIDAIAAYPTVETIGNMDPTGDAYAAAIRDYNHIIEMVNAIPEEARATITNLSLIEDATLKQYIQGA